MNGSEQASTREVMFSFGKITPYATLKSPVIDVGRTLDVEAKGVTEIVHTIKDNVHGIRPQDLKRDVQFTLAAILDAFDDEHFTKHNMRVDEIEFAISVTEEGGISIVSCVSGTASTNKTFTVRLANTNGRKTPAE